MIVNTNNQRVATEVLSAQGLITNTNAFDEITIESIGNLKYAMNDYDARVTVSGITFILFRDLDFKNVNMKNLNMPELNGIEFRELDNSSNLFK